MYSSNHKTNKSVQSFKTPAEFYDTEQALSFELENLRAQRNELCKLFLSQQCKIPDFCMGLDRLGKKFADNCFYASTQGRCK